MATVLSGISGAVSIAGNTTGVTTIADWSIAPGKQMTEASASQTNGSKVVVFGNENWTGKLRAYGKVPPVYPGDSISFVGYNGSGSFAGSALVASCRGNFPIASGGVISWDIEFKGTSTVTRGTTVVADATSPAMYSAAACKVQRAGSDMAGVQGFTLELACDLKDYVDSQIIKRVVGSKRLSASIDVDEADPAVQIASGDYAVYKFFVDASTFYQVSYGALGEPEQNVPIESGDIVAYRMPLKFSLYSGTTRGSVVKPGAAGNFIS